MSERPPLGSAENPVRVAVVGAGPAGFFTADTLLRHRAPVFQVDVFERLPTPFGLVRTGVAPDHQKIKSVTRTFDKMAAHGRFRFFGNVTVGHHLTHEELAERYDQVVYAVGSSTDRRLGIPGEELSGCHAATAFVGWYNAHPDFHSFSFDLGCSRAVVVGVGNVALDIARVLLRGREELSRTDIASSALQALRKSPIREVVLLARRGPAQVAYTPIELEAIAALGVDIRVNPAHLEDPPEALGPVDESGRRHLALLRKLAGAAPRGEKSLTLEFFAAPVELTGDQEGRVRAVRVERTALVPGSGGPRARGTGRFFSIESPLVFRCIGYVGVPVPGVPFDFAAGTIPNLDGRVTDSAGGAVIPGCYAVGWIRRSATGVIGTNKADAHGVAQRLIEDVPQLAPAPLRHALEAERLLAQRGVRITTFADWATLDALEVAAGQRVGKVREKFATVAAMMNALLAAHPPSDAGDEESAASAPLPSTSDLSRGPGL